MSLNTAIRAAITPIVTECVPDQYGGTATEYCTFNYSEIPDAFGDESLPSRGAWIETNSASPPPETWAVAPLAGSVD